MQENLPPFMPILKHHWDKKIIFILAVQRPDLLCHERLIRHFVVKRTGGHVFFGLFIASECRCPCG